MKKKQAEFRSAITKHSTILDKKIGKYVDTIRFSQKDGNFGEIQLPRSSVFKINELATELLDRGASLPENPRADLSKLSSSKAKHEYVFEKQFGWTDNRKNYVFLDGNLLGEERIIGVNFPGPFIGRTSSGGTVKSWVSTVPRIAAHSSLMMCILCTPFAAPLLRIVDADPFSVCIFGRTRGGKSITKLIAASVMGFKNKKSLPSWHQTNAHLEEASPAYNDAVLLIDDFQLIRPKSKQYERISELAYALAEGREKGRHSGYTGKKGGSAESWSNIVVTSSEYSVAELANREGAIRDGGEILRLIDLPAFAEGQTHIFDRSKKLVTASVAENLSNDALKAVDASHGTVFKPYLRFLIAKNKLPEYVEARINFFLQRVLSENDDSIVRDIARKFGLLYAAGCLARQAKLLPWEKADIRDAVATCFLRAKRVLHTDENVLHEGMTMLNARLSGLPLLNKTTKKFSSAYCSRIKGFRRISSGNHVALIKPEAYLAIFASRRQARLVTSTLLKSGAMTRATNKDGREFSGKTHHQWPDKRRRSWEIRFKPVSSGTQKSRD